MYIVKITLLVLKNVIDCDPFFYWLNMGIKKMISRSVLLEQTKRKPLAKETVFV